MSPRADSPDRSSRARRRSFGALLVFAVAWSSLVLLCSCDGARQRAAASLTGGDPHQGLRTIERVGCGACHLIPGVPAAHGHVGPSLAGLAQRSYIGGVLTNDPDHLIAWLLDPRAHSPRTAMPQLGLKPDEARNIAAYLYTLRD